jgi:hypothetical protein
MNSMELMPTPSRPRVDMSANYLTTEILLEITKQGLGVAWRNNRIDAMAAGKDGRPRRVSAGINGQADITGILPDGRRLEIEVKVGKDKQSAAQIAFGRMIESHGGVYIVARDLGECIACIKARIRIPEITYGRMQDL